MEDDSLLLRVAHLLLVRRRLLAGAAIVEVHLRPQPHRRAGHVHRHVSGPDDRHPLPQLWRIVQPHVAQELGVDQHPFHVRPRDGQADALVRTHGDEHAVEPLGEEVVQIINRRVQPQFHPQVNNVLHLPVHDPGGQAVFWHPHAQHPTGHRQRLEDCDPVPQFAQILGGGKPARPRADDRHALRVGAG